MTEHVCEWIAMTLREPISQRGQFFFKCSSHDCPSLLMAPQVQTRLNEYETLKAATERLSVKNVKRAEMAMAITFKYLDKASKSIVEDEVLPALRAYADTLEGE